MIRPNATDAERAVLGAVLMDSSVLDKVDLEPDEFYDISHQEIYQAMREIGSGSLDAVTLSEFLERKGSDVSILYLTKLVRECPSTYNYDNYVSIIKDTASRRRIISCAESLAQSAFDENTNLSDVVSDAMTGLISSIRMTGGAIHSKHFLKQLYEIAEERSEDPKEIYGLKTNLIDFDKITRGLQKGEQFVLSGAPGTGKSLLAFQMACGMASNGYAGVIYELEMSGVAVWRRRISAESKIPTQDINSGWDMKERWESFSRVIAESEKLPIFISQDSDWTTTKMRADLSKLKHKYNVEWFIVDYMGLLSDHAGSDDIQRQTFISHQLRAIAKDLDLAGLCLQSVTKAGYSRPTMANVSGPTAIHHDADQIAILVESDDTENVMELRWEKNREGDRSGLLRLVKTPGLPLFQSYQKEEPPWRT